jgi:hypothetical protein
MPDATTPVLLLLHERYSFRGMTNERAVKLLRAAVAEAGGQAAWARAHGITQAAVSLTLSGHRQPGPQILAALGLARVTRIAKVPTDAE